ncbi:50S ribosomal protein L31 [Candidatus Karelsulcia muelleri]
MKFILYLKLSHPTYIGKLKYLKKAGRIEKFHSRYKVVQR